MSLVETKGSARRRALVILAAVILPVAAGYGWIRFSPRSTPAGQPPLAVIASSESGGSGGQQAGGLEPLRAAVNAAADRDRLLVLLSPT